MYTADTAMRIDITMPFKHVFYHCCPIRICCSDDDPYSGYMYNNVVLYTNTDIQSILGTNVDYLD